MKPSMTAKELVANIQSGEGLRNCFDWLFNFTSWVNLYQTEKLSSQETIDFFVAVSKSPFAYDLVKIINPDLLPYDHISLKIATNFAPREADDFNPDCKYERRGGKIPNYDLYATVVMPLAHPDVRAILQPINENYLFELAYNKRCLETTVPDNVKKLLAANNRPLSHYTQIPYISWFANYIDGTVPYDSKKCDTLYNHAPNLWSDAITKNWRIEFLNFCGNPDVFEWTGHPLRQVRKRLDAHAATTPANKHFYDLLRPLCYGHMPVQNARKIRELIAKYIVILMQNGAVADIENLEKHINHTLDCALHKYKLRDKYEYIDLQRIQQQAAAGAKSQVAVDDVLKAYQADVAKVQAGRVR